MQKIFSIILLSVFCLSGKMLSAQELNAEVQVLSPKVRLTSKQIFQTLETAVREFLNNRKWTEETYSIDERIECQFVLTIDDYIQPDGFSGTLQIVYSRPVFMSNYDSPMFIHKDTKLQFTYLENSRLDFNMNSNLSNLTSILAYYAYVIIGLDHDSYSPLGGSPFYQQAQRIVGNAQGGAYGGWNSFDGNANRFWLTDNLTSPAFDNFRMGLYQYHRQGLDQMHEPSQQKAAKEAIKNALLGLEEVQKKRRNSMVMRIFFDSKSQEIIQLFSGGPALQDLVALKEILIELDANNASKYEAMGRG